MTWRHALAALFLAVVATPVVAQSTYSGCLERSDDANCRARRERHQFGIYGAHPVAELARDGVEVRRLFLLDAHYADLGLIAFSRDHGGTPRLSLQSPGYGLNRDPPLSIPIPLPAWEEIRAESEAFHQGRRMAAVAADAVCVDAWSYIVETGTPADGATLPRSATRIVDQCSGPQHPAWLARRALGLLPACTRLAEPAGSDYDALMLCARLRAEPAAVETYVALAPLFEGSNADGDAVRAAFAPEAVLDWDGVPPAGTAAERWLRELRSRSGDLAFDRIEALGNDRARLTGYVVFSQPQARGDARTYRARAVLELARDGAGRLRIVRARIGRYIRA
jgi:hypothetical protein